MSNKKKFDAKTASPAEVKAETMRRPISAETIRLNEGSIDQHLDRLRP